MTRGRGSRVALALLLCGCGEASSSSEPVAPAHVASADCPLKVPADWQAFLETLVDDQHWVMTCSDLQDCGPRLGDFLAHVESNVASVLARCSVDLERNPAIAACTEHLRRYLPAFVEQHQTGSYGFRQPNVEYFTAQAAPNVPAGMMDPPSALFAALPTRAAVEAAARDQGMVYLTHDSCLGGVRTFVHVVDSQGRFEQWLLFGMENDASAVSDPTIVSFIAVQKTDAGGVPLPKPRLHFRDYLAASGASGWTLSLPDGFEGKCYGCHTSGLRALVPSLASITESAPVRGEPGFGVDPPPDFGAERLAALNDRLVAGGPPDWNDTIRPADHGPVLGATLGCTECHDGRTRGTLSVSSSEGTLRQKMVGQLSMRSYADGVSVPDERAMELLAREQSGDPPLGPEEASELAAARAQHQADYDAFVAARFPDWKAWMLERSCE